MVGVDKKGYISCQGESGSCAFGASRVHYFNFTAAPQPSFEEVVRRVVERDAQIGILPIQNSRSGLIGEPLTVLARSDVKIIAEHHQPIRHHLMVNRSWVQHIASPEALMTLEAFTDPEKRKAASPQDQLDYDQVVRSLLSQITAIYSDEQGLKQCDRGLKINLAGAERRLTSCTAKASRVIAHETDMAKLAKHELPAYAAIASEECATMYKNVRLVANLNDDNANTTRYVVVSRNEAKPAQIIADIDVKAILSKLTAEDLAGFYEFEPLHADYEKLSSDFAFGPSSFKAGQEASARAKLLREYIASDRNALSTLLGHLSHFDHPAQLRIKKALGPLVKQIHDHVEKAKGRDEGEIALKRLLRSKEYANRVRSIFIIRGRNSKVTQADLLKALVEYKGKARKEKLEFTVIAEVPRPIDGKDEGLGLVIEADGSLLGAKFAKKKKKTAGFTDWLPSVSEPSSGEASELERVLRQIHDEEDEKKGVATIQVLGTFAKELGTLGVAKPVAADTHADKPDSSKPQRMPGWREQPRDEPVNASGAGALAVLLFFSVAGAAAWYAWSAHLIAF
jgi:prephenate dehydratase